MVAAQGRKENFYIKLDRRIGNENYSVFDEKPFGVGVKIKNDTEGRPIEKARKLKSGRRSKLVWSG
jgi:hypothetical protein